tara:strand:- start:520 stop:1242 length:723 start_codon:yes stop_codon:yes gene_type:complete
MALNKLSIIVLAGGYGTRIKPILGKVPKLLAPIKGFPFFEFFFNWLKNSLNNINFDLVISSGIGHDELSYYFSENYNFVKLVKEEEPLGTFGAVLNSFKECRNNNILILNGDTIFDVCLENVFLDYLKLKNNPLHIVKRSSLNERYGGYEIVNGILKLSEKNTSLISMGATFVHKDKLGESQNLEELNTAKPLMMDKHFISRYNSKAYILEENINFIDIGTPESLSKAQYFIPTLLENNL